MLRMLIDSARVDSRDGARRAGWQILTIVIVGKGRAMFNRQQPNVGPQDYGHILSR